jgi:hypothetical protein
VTQRRRKRHDKLVREGRIRPSRAIEHGRAAYGGVDFARLEAIRARYDRDGLLAPRRAAA